MNISNNTGSGMTSFGVSFGSGSRWMDSSIVLVEGVVVVLEVVEQVQEAELVHLVEFVIDWKQRQV